MLLKAAFLIYLIKMVKYAKKGKFLFKNYWFILFIMYNLGMINLIKIVKN